MAATTTDSPSRKKTGKQASGGGKDDKKRKLKEYNKHWKGYVFIFLSSLISKSKPIRSIGPSQDTLDLISNQLLCLPLWKDLSAASNASNSLTDAGSWQMAVTFGSVTFALSCLILVLDRTKWLNEKCGDYTKAYDGKLEGTVLVLFIVWWIIGVGYQTQVDGIAYLANNVYFSAWLCLASCIYTLNKWSTEKDILSIEEITSISITLPSWYLLLFGSMIVTGTSMHLWFEVSDDLRSEAALGMALGAGSLAVSSIWIMAHYNFIEVINEGGWLELCSSFLAILLWIVGCAVLTQEGGIAATLVGDGCRNSLSMGTSPENCTFSYLNERNQIQQEQCTDIRRRLIPGSNLYASLWLCLGSAISVAFKWKKQQAQNFAHAAQQKAGSGKAASSQGNDDDHDDDDDDDDDESLNDFHDVDVF